MKNASMILSGLAMICFFLAMIGFPTDKEPKLIAAGLFLLSLALVVGQVK